jgi:hypothetical protein
LKLLSNETTGSQALSVATERVIKARRLWGDNSNGIESHEARVLIC